MTGPDLLATCWTTAGDAVPLPGRGDSPLDLAERIAAAAGAGFAGFGIVHNDLARYLEDHSLGDLRRMLDDNGVRHVELEFLTDWWCPVGSPERRASDDVVDLLRRAAEVLHPHHIKVGPDIHAQPYELDLWAAEWYRIADIFADVGATLALEFMPFSNLSTLERAVELVRAAGHPSGGLMIDMWHIMRGAGTLADVAALPMGLIVGVELDDGDAEQIDDGYSDTVLRRKIPGHGVWDVPALIRVLVDKGWAGPWGVEILSEVYRVRPLAEALPEVHRETLRQFERAGITTGSGYAAT